MLPKARCLATRTDWSFLGSQTIPFHIFGANTSRSKAEEWQLALAFFQNLQETFAPVDVPQPQSSLEPGMATMLRLRRVDTSKWEKKIIFSMKIVILGSHHVWTNPYLTLMGANSQVNWKQRILRRLELGCFPLGTASSAQQPQYQTFSSPLPSAYITAHPQVCCYFTQITQFCWPLTPSYMFVLPFSLVFSAQDFLEPHCFACGSPFLSWVSPICPRLQPVFPNFSHEFSQFWLFPMAFPTFFHGFPMDFPVIEVLTYAAAADACALGRRMAPLTELLEVLPRRALSNLQNLRKGTGDGWYPRYWVNMWVIWIGMWYQKNLYSKIYPRDWLVWWIVDIMD